MVLLVQAPSHAGRIYTEKPLGHILEQNDLRALSKAVLSPVELVSLERTHSSREFGNFIEAVRFYFDEIENRVLLEHAKLPLLRDLRSARSVGLSVKNACFGSKRHGGSGEVMGKTAQMLTTSGKTRPAI